MRELAQRIASAKPVSSAVLLLQDLAPRNAGGRESRTTGPQRIRTTISGETTATLQPAISVRSTVRLKPPSEKSLQPGDSKPVSLVVIRQVGNVVIFLSLGEPDGIVSELFRSEPQAHRLTTVSPRRTQGSHHVDSPIHELTEVETRTTVGSLQVVSRHERIKKISNQNAKSMASNGNFEQKLIKESRRRNACAGARLQRPQGVEEGGTDCSAELNRAHRGTREGILGFLQEYGTWQQCTGHDTQ